MFGSKQSEARKIRGLYMYGSVGKCVCVCVCVCVCMYFMSVCGVCTMSCIIHVHVCIYTTQ